MGNTCCKHGENELSLIQEERKYENSKTEDIWQPTGDAVRAFVEVSYSDERRKEMLQSREKNCSILISLLSDQLKKEGIEKVHVMVPADKKRFADMVFFVESERKVNWETLKRALLDLGGDNIGNVQAFVVEGQ